MYFYPPHKKFNNCFCNFSSSLLNIRSLFLTFALTALLFAGNRVVAAECTPLIYTRAFTDHSTGEFTIFSEAGNYYRWSANQFGAVLNGYNSNDAESDWLISPAFALSGYKSATLSFYHTCYKGTDLSKAADYLKLKVGTFGSDIINQWMNGEVSISWDELPNSTFSGTDSVRVEISWDELPISTFSGSDFVRVEITLPEAYLTDSVRFAFHYTSDPDDKPHAYYWEIKDFALSADCESGGQPETAVTYLPIANTFYDFDGDGYKEAVFSDNGYFCITGNQLADFQVKEKIKASFTDPIRFIEDINHDGIMDYVATKDSYSNITLSQPDGTYTQQNNSVCATNMDINGDGRIDYIRWNSANQSVSYYIALQQPDGSFREQAMQIMTKEQYEAQFDPNAWGSTVHQEWNGLIGVTPNIGPIFSGASLAQAPRKVPHPQRAQGIGQQVPFPTKVLDLNADGLLDLINENTGDIFYNMGDGKWVHTATNGAVFTADFNGDGIMDFIFPGSKLQTAIYQGNGVFQVKTLYENIQVDNDIYCYDFDNDGDVDILVTFSAPYNNTGYAYTMFFRNDGNGNFTQLEEQDYGDSQLVFSNCQDIDGDGYYDLLAFRSTYSCTRYGCSMTSPVKEVVWLRGQADMTFAQPEVLFSISKSDNNGNSRNIDLDGVKINAEDLDNDGKMEIWVSGLNNSVADQFIIHKPDAAANTAPTPPAKPELSYSDGILTVNWGNGTDSRTATADLTYALRIGTASGKQDILHAHANADGTRRNYLDGNMGRYHTYTIDLTSYIADNIYVAVQAIDAQHLGSVWSGEAVVRHHALPVSFNLSSTSANKGQPVSVTFTPTADGYTHLWTAQDGVCTTIDESTVQIVFSAAGEKTITHTLTAPDGRVAQATQTVMVNPNGIGTPVPITNDIYYSLSGSYYTPQYGNLFDYNFDGYLDIVYNNVVSKGDENYMFSKASGIWNTGLEMYNNECFWYDWTHNGAADLLARINHNNQGALGGYYLPHNGTNNMTAKKSDANIDMYWKGSDNGIYRESWVNIVDWTHNGYYDVYTHRYADNGKSISSFAVYQNGSFVERDIQSNADSNLLTGALGYNDRSQIRFIADIDHDGFMDGAILHCYESPYSDLAVMLNKGNLHFEQLIIPFAQEIASPGTVPNDYMHDMQNAQLIDLNNDGYYDIFAVRYADGAPYILWNNQNQSFSAPDLLPLGNLSAFTTNRFGIDAFTYQFADLDNNGYIDIISFQLNPKMGENIYNIYVHYMGEKGVVQQGFLLQSATSFGEFRLLNMAAGGMTIMAPLKKTTSTGYTEYYDPCIYPITGIENQRPAAPTGLRAVQTDEGLLIEWNAAEDDRTPAAQMRYNLSVKRAGQTGNGAYLISPQNGGNANAAYMPRYHYQSATRFLIPQSEIEVGKYEISLQSIDLQNAMSLFADPVTVSVSAVSRFSAPTSVCLNDNATFAYTGTQQTATPVWDFDGGITDSGSGYGPYQVHWTTAGTKTVRLTVNGEISERMIYVEDFASDYTLPSYYINDGTTTLHLPADAVCSWAARYEDDTDFAPLSAFAGIIEITGDQLTLCHPAGSKDLYLQLTLTNGNGCQTTQEQRMHVIGQDQLPQLTIVTPDADGRNVLTWDTASLTYLTEVRIYKETNRRNQFVELSAVPASAGTYTDHTSDASTKAERYCIAGVLPDGTLTPQSTPHRTLHLTINRGMQDNTWNLLWNDYTGADIATYNILRGASPETLAQIISLSGGNTSYTDRTPDASAPLYAIEYVLNNASAQSAPRRIVQHLTAAPRGTSNVVNSNEARKVVYAERMSVLSANNSYTTTTDKTSLFLYVEIFPTNTTYRTVRWDIIDGSNLATIDDNGLLTARTPNAGGTVTVRATTTDGTNLTATRQIQIAAVSGGITTDYSVTNLQSVINGKTVTLTWSAQTIAPMYHITATHLATNTQVINALWSGSMSITETLTETGEYRWSVQALSNDSKPLSETVYGTFTISETAISNIPAGDTPAVRKILRDGQVLILRGGRTYTLMGIETE